MEKAYGKYIYDFQRLSEEESVHLLLNELIEEGFLDLGQTHTYLNGSGDYFQAVTTPMIKEKIIGQARNLGSHMKVYVDGDQLHLTQANVHFIRSNKQYE